MTADEPVEGPRCEPRCSLCPRYCRNPPSPSVPVESREQPSGFRGGRIPPYPQESITMLMGQLAELTAERDRARDLAAHLEEDTGKEGDALKSPDA